MTNTQQFIEDAVKGGLKYGHGVDGDYETDGWTVREIVDEPHLAAEILLDPLAWQAVGETRRWADMHYTGEKPPEDIPYWLPGWHAHWHRFIDHLADGKTIEEALAAIA